MGVGVATGDLEGVGDGVATEDLEGVAVGAEDGELPEILGFLSLISCRMAGSDCDKMCSAVVRLTAKQFGISQEPESLLRAIISVLESSRYSKTRY